MKCKIYLCLIFILLPSYGHSFISVFTQDVSQFGANGLSLIKAPISWTYSNWITLGIIGSSASILYQNKQTDTDGHWFLFDRLYGGSREEGMDPKTYFEKVYTDMILTPLPSIGFVIGGSYLFTGLIPLPKEHQLFSELLQSILWSQSLATFGSFILSEKRPLQGGNMEYFHSGGHSISGHSTFYTSMSGPLDKYFTMLHPDDSVSTQILKYSGKAIIYGTPLLLSYSRLRITSGNIFSDHKTSPHYLWNVLLGVSLGYAVGEYMASPPGFEPGSPP